MAVRALAVLALQAALVMTAAEGGIGAVVAEDMTSMQGMDSVSSEVGPKEKAFLAKSDRSLSEVGDVYSEQDHEAANAEEVGGDDATRAPSSGATGLARVASSMRCAAPVGALRARTGAARRFVAEWQAEGCPWSSQTGSSLQQLSQRVTD
eukprot:CAMPEP_0195065042 /NCGR_PEP_ID=MMETSP0448-20130528/10815_1 /TAXON_ID=66468 /ORGANISM="Heterocapsa triquestra, Strain CCMP 448" /LENGTH=150 /DNA_ID=CAMNT_0040096097 /DNA_START=90 /DNA_END=543 /DNA_ORIENTATION=-